MAKGGSALAQAGTAGAAATGAQAQGGADPAAQGLVTIESDIQKADNTTGVITAQGNVRIVDGGRGVVATARQAQYYSREGRVVLSGDVEILHQDGHRLQAEQVVYLLGSERLIARPSQGGQVISRYRMGPAQGSSEPPPASPVPNSSRPQP